MNEMARISFLINRDGVAATVEWVRRTLSIYRSSVINPVHYANSREYRREFIGSYISFKHWLAEQKSLQHSQ